MANITLSSAFDTENLWALRLAGAITTTSTAYEFQSAFGFVRVTGTGFTYVGSAITGGNYTSILVATDASFSTPIATYSSGTSHNAGFFFLNGSSDALANADTINGSSGNDIITSRGGGDTLDGKNGSDTYVIDISDLVSGWSLTDTGASGTDTVRLIGSDVQFHFDNKPFGGIEALTFTDRQNAKFDSSQLPTNLAVTGVNGSSQSVSVANATNFSAAGWTFTRWEAIDHVIIEGTSGADTIVGSSKTDIIRSSGGADTFDGAGGSDQYSIDSTDLVTGPAINDTGASGVDLLDLTAGTIFDFASAGAAISGIEALRLSGGVQAIFNADQLPAVLAVTIASGSTITIDNAVNFSAAKWTWGALQTPVATISGTAGDDHITGSTLGDTINGDDGGDVLRGGRGNDTLAGGIGLDTLTGGLGKDFLIGGADKDVFDFNVKTETPKGFNRDGINDFSGIAGGELDRIDLRGIDANSTIGGNQAFHFIGTHNFHHKAGELHYRVNGDHVLVEGDINGNGKADFQIEVHNVSNDLQVLAKGDFVL